MRRFSEEELFTVHSAAVNAQRLVSRYYALAPREWARMRYEVKTQKELKRGEMLDSVLAHLVCYEYARSVGQDVLESGDIYRICLQDSRILATLAHISELDLERFLIYILTHELVHVVRFGQRLQRLDLPADERHIEEQSVETITRRILGFESLFNFEATEEAQSFEKQSACALYASNSLWD